MKVTRAEILRNLPKKGFRKESLHHIYFYHEYKGMETGAYTYISHSAKQKDVSGDLISSMRKQLRLDSMKETVALIKCPMDKKEYEKILIDRSIFDPSTISKNGRSKLAKT
ncbi:MAG: hypothetical protein C4B58_13540 [Deltaproteobacteria bacterium]|nr:MAG: hypothetical protein C4B58_13540 [Deltaproteobacteria bacterium]